MSVGQRARRRGVTLIEAVLYIAIALALIIGGLVFFNQASRAQKTSDAVRMMSSLVAEARTLYQTDKIKIPNVLPFYQQGESATLVASGSVPQQYVRQTTVAYTGATYTSQIINPWGGQAEVFFTTSAAIWGDITPNGYISVFLQGIPVESCARMVASNADTTKTNVLTPATNPIAGTIFGVTIGDSEKNQLAMPTAQMRTYSPGQAAQACRYGSFAYGNTIGDYKGTALPLRTVNIMFVFSI